jgi:hypothetical protein
MRYTSATSTSDWQACGHSPTAGSLQDDWLRVTAWMDEAANDIDDFDTLVTDRRPPCAKSSNPPRPTTSAAFV